GCGTGFLTHYFLNDFAPTKYFINDIVEENINNIRRICEKENFSNWEFLCGDAENINFENNLDLIISTSTFQWFENFETFIYKAYKLLSPGGILAFTSFGPKNLKEIRANNNSGLNYLSLTQIKEIVSNNFNIKNIFEENHVLTFDEPIQVLKHMKLTGVNGNSNKRWKASDLKTFDYRYRKLNNKQNSFELSYNPIYIIAQKPNIL
nr:methyltransferase domain-containing protein [Bacteroidales bacterium]